MMCQSSMDVGACNWCFHIVEMWNRIKNEVIAMKKKKSSNTSKKSFQRTAQKAQGASADSSAVYPTTHWYN